MLQVEWVAVEERLPSHSLIVWVWDAGNQKVRLAYCWSQNRAWYRPNDWALSPGTRVTHWAEMVVPAPPEGAV